MVHAVRNSRNPFPPRIEQSVREEARPPRVSTILCLILGAMALLALVGKAFTYLSAAT